MTTRNEFEFFSSFKISLEDFYVFTATVLLLNDDVFKIKKGRVSNKGSPDVFHRYFNHTLLAKDGILFEKETTNLTGLSQSFQAEHDEASCYCFSSF